MSNIDDTIKAALQEDEIPASELHISEESLLKQVLLSFRVQNKFLVFWVFLVMFGMMGLMIWGLIEFFSTSDINLKLQWGLLILFTSYGISMLKLWYWMQLNKYSVMREIKRLEFQIAKLREEKSV